MKISCIIPTCDRPIFLKEALDSILKQTVEPYEIIVANNGKIAMELPELMLKKIKVFNIEPNSGASKARNYGANKAQGGYLAFLDDDDLWGEKYLENVEKEISKGAVCVASRIDKLVDGRISDYKNPHGKMTIENFLIYNPGFGGTNLVIKKEIFLKVGGFNPKFPTSEDKSLAIELLKMGVEIRTLPDNQSIARFHDGGHLSDPSTIMCGTKKFLSKYGELMSKKQYLFNLFKISKYKYESGVKSAIFPYIFLAVSVKVMAFFSRVFLRAKVYLLKAIKNLLPKSFLKFVNYQRLFIINVFFPHKKNFRENVIFFRDDDVCEITPRLEKLINIFIKLRLPIDFAVIPGEINQTAVEFLINLKNKYPDLFYFHQHGFRHIDYGENKSYEFGGKRSYDEQYHDIKIGRELMKKYFGDKDDNVFTPPSHGFDNNTLKVLDELDFDYISLGGKGFSVSDHKVKAILAKVDFIDWHSRHPLKRAWKIKNEINYWLSKDKIVGIILHHEYFSDKDFKEIEKILLWSTKKDYVKYKNIVKLQKV